MNRASVRVQQQSTIRTEKVSSLAVAPEAVAVRRAEVIVADRPSGEQTAGGRITAVDRVVRDEGWAGEEGTAGDCRTNVVSCYSQYGPKSWEGHSLYCL